MRYLILAAGMGKRMGAGAAGPVLIDIGGEPLIGRLLRQIRTHDPAADIHVVLGYRAEIVAPALPAAGS
jgi:choline kinase